MGSKAREGAKAMSLVFVLLDFPHAGVRRRAQCTLFFTNSENLPVHSQVLTGLYRQTEPIINITKHF